MFAVGDKVTFSLYHGRYSGTVEKVGTKNMTIRYTKGAGSHLFKAIVPQDDPRAYLWSVGQCLSTREWNGEGGPIRTCDLPRGHEGEHEDHSEADDTAAVWCWPQVEEMV